MGAEKEKLLEFQEVLDSWIDDRVKKLEQKRDWLEDLKAKEALAPVEDILPSIETLIDLDLSSILGE